MRCPYCKSKDVRRYSSFSHIEQERYRCDICGKVFLRNERVPPLSTSDQNAQVAAKQDISIQPRWSEQSSATGTQQQISAHDDWLTVLEAADYIKMTVRTVYNACMEGSLKHVRVSGRKHIRLRRAWVDGWLERHAHTSLGGRKR